MSIFNQWPWTNFNEYNLDWVIKTVKEALADVSDTIATYFTSHLDTTLRQSGKAADAAAVGREITNLNSNYTSLNGNVGGLTTRVLHLNTEVGGLTTSVSNLNTKVGGLTTSVSNLNTEVGGLTTSVSNLNTEVGNKANGIVIDGDNRAFLKGNYTTLHTLLEDNHKSVDVWVKSGTVYYKALQVAGGPEDRVIIMCKYADSRFHSLGCDADNTITGIRSDPSYCVIFDITRNTVINSTKTSAYSTIKTMYDNYGPYDIVVKISNFDQAIPYNVWFNGVDTLKITYRDSTDTKHTISLTMNGTMTVS